MTRQHGTSLIRGATPRPASPMTVDITRLGRRPGAMVTLRETVLSPSRIGLEMIAIDRVPRWNWTCGSSRCPKGCW